MEMSQVSQRMSPVMQMTGVTPSAFTRSRLKKMRYVNQETDTVTKATNTQPQKFTSSHPQGAELPGHRKMQSDRP